MGATSAQELSAPAVVAIGKPVTVTVAVDADAAALDGRLDRSSSGHASTHTGATLAL